MRILSTLAKESFLSRLEQRERTYNWKAHDKDEVPAGRCHACRGSLSKVDMLTEEARAEAERHNQRSRHQHFPSSCWARDLLNALPPLTPSAFLLLPENIRARIIQYVFGLPSFIISHYPRDCKPDGSGRYYGLRCDHYGCQPQKEFEERRSVCSTCVHVVLSNRLSLLRVNRQLYLEGREVLLHRTFDIHIDPHRIGVVNWTNGHALQAIADLQIYRAYRVVIRIERMPNRDVVDSLYLVCRALLKEKRSPSHVILCSLIPGDLYWYNAGVENWTLSRDLGYRLLWNWDWLDSLLAVKEFPARISSGIALLNPQSDINVHAEIHDGYLFRNAWEQGLTACSLHFPRGNGEPLSSHTQSLQRRELEDLFVEQRAGYISQRSLVANLQFGDDNVKTFWT